MKLKKSARRRFYYRLARNSIRPGTTRFDSPREESYRRTTDQSDYRQLSPTTSKYVILRCCNDNVVNRMDADTVDKDRDRWT